MRFGSVCSGIEAASVAWHPLGWKAAWLSEIEFFPSAVLAHHYPDVPNLGDMTQLPERILSGEVEAPDVFCGGTPCQAFSVAGLRNSLDDARGNLSLMFCEIANAIDNKRIAAGLAPAVIFWENVPGVLSTKDNAFGCFLAGLAGEDNPLEPPGGKWTNSGYVLGPKRAVAWRLLDAQYFGVAQRRKRVFVVASARADFDPAAVLFEFDGVRRDTAPSREAGKTIAPCVTNGPPFSRTGNERVEAEAMVVQKKQWPADIASTLDTTFGTKQGLEDQHVNAGCPLFVPDCAPTLRVNRPGEGGMPGDAGQLIPVVANTLNCLQGIQAPDTFNYIVHGTQDPCVSDIAFAQGRNNGGENVLVHPISIHPHCIGRAPEAGPQGKEYLLDGSAYCMDSRGQPQAVAQPIIGGVDYENNAHGPDDVTGPLLKGSPTSGGRPLPAIALQSMAVRRLTPIECERLQGFPDNYTNIPWRKKDESPDGPRYKALGNSWAVPVVRWIGRRIQEQINADT
jgi:DNA (cytosine-5)-methyltransferase 1